MTQLVGILNVTPDSFSDGGEYLDPSAALAHAEQLFNDGATLIDVGAESTRPGAQQLTGDQEWGRLEGVLPMLLQRYPGKIMLDSYHPQTVRRAFQLGAVIVNDVTCLTNPAMRKAVLELQPTGVVISHLPATSPKIAHAQEPLDDILKVHSDLMNRAKSLIDAGFDQDRIILDPGIGFGKTRELNRQLLRFPELVPNFRTMIGHSRKRFLGDNRLELEPNLEAARIAIAAGASYLRVHDVAGHSQLTA